MTHAIRRMQFSLRTLAGIVLAMSVLLGVLSWAGAFKDLSWLCGGVRANPEDFVGDESTDTLFDGSRNLVARLLIDRGEVVLKGVRKADDRVRVWLDTYDRTDKPLKEFYFELRDPLLLRATDGRARWLNADSVLLQFGSRRKPSQSSRHAALAIVDLVGEKVVKISKLLEIGEDILVSPDGKRAICGREYGIGRADDGAVHWFGRGMTYTVELVDLERLYVICTLDDESEGQDRTITRKIWSPDGKFIVTVGDDDGMRVWDGADGTWIASMTGHTDSILDARFASDSRTLVTASEDRTARVWDVATGRTRVVLSGHQAGLNCAIFDQKGEHVLTGSEDTTARLWSVATGKQLQVWDRHRSAVREVSFANDAKEACTKTAVGVERRWPIDKPAE